TVLTGLFATGFSVTILAVSIPEIADDLGSSTSVLTFVITGPFLAIALAMPLLGKLGDVRGHRRLYLVGLAGFSVATACTALAWSALRTPRDRACDARRDRLEGRRARRGRHDLGSRCAAPRR